MEKNCTGKVHLYVGDGKGKTTAAVGLAVRALGSGKRVLFCQFLKGRVTGELGPLAQLGAIILRAKEGGKFIGQMSDSERIQAQRDHSACLEQARGIIFSGNIDLAVLDESVDAVGCGMLRLDSLMRLIEDRPAHAELVLTGRDPGPELREAADYYTDFRCVKHPYTQGLPARKGIEF